MSDDQKSTVFALALLLAMFLQVVLVFADQMDSPGRTAVKFAEAYYALDPSMKSLLCSEALENEEADLLDEFLSRAAEEARTRGYDPSFMRSKLLHVETHTTSLDENTATVRITGARKRMIHPIFTWVAQIFLLGETYPLDQTIEVVKENGRWKVCEKDLPLPAV